MCPDMTEKIADWDVKNQNNQTNLFLLHFTKYILQSKR